ncbi:MAG: PKD domain-containing protein [Candidatus Bathyarchaeia archaeon]
MTALTLIILISNVALSTPVEAQNSTAQYSTGLSIVSHKITTQEISEIKKQLSSNQETDYTQKVDGHGTGFSGPTLEDLEEIAQNAHVIDSISYPNTTASIDNSATQWFPPIGNQDGEGSCVAWTVGYYMKTYQEAKEHNWDLTGASWEGGTYGHPSASYQDKIMSPEFIYSLINGGKDQGAEFEYAINLVSSIGVCSWATMPFAPFDVISWPTEAAWTEAAYYRSSTNPNYQYIYANTEEGLLNLKNWLAAGNLAVIAIDADQYDAFTKQDVLISYNSSKELNHANTIVGYDDNLNYTINDEVHFGAFKIANSWGVGEWENVPDGFYWVPYEIMLQLSSKENPAIIFDDLINYQPQLTASFIISHKFRGECTITIGYGTTAQPLATKVFSNAVIGGNQPFCSNKIVVDITELKREMSSFYNQPFFLSVYDNLTRSTGVVTYFAVGDSVSLDAPVQTSHLRTVSLSLSHTLVMPSLVVSPSSGSAGQEITLQGTGFTANNTVDLTYLNPTSKTWVTIANNIPVSQSNSFTYTFNAPNLRIGNPAGDHLESFDNILFAAKDNSNGYTFNSETPFTEYRKGLTLVGNIAAAGLFGNNTNFNVLVEAGQSLTICGKNFNPGTLTAVYDGIYNMGSAIVDAKGNFNTTFTIPNQASAGQHTIILDDNFMITVTQLPKIVADYDGNWKSSSFNVQLSADSIGVSEIYYKINDGETKTVSANGQPYFNVENANNILEYWGIWSNGTSTIELTHRILSGIKLDKTAPSGSMKINSGAELTASNTVTLTLSCSDALSGVQKMRFSNDGTWTESSWEPYLNSKSWSLTSEDGTKTVYCQIMDSVGFTVSFEASIVLDTTAPLVNLGGDRSTIIGSSVDFTADGSDQNGIESIVWNFGDNTTAEGKQVNHVYVESGNYTVTVQVRDGAGNLAEKSINVNVEPKNQSTPAAPENQTLQIPIETSSVLAVLFVGFGLILIFIKYKQRIFSRKN